MPPPLDEPGFDPSHPPLPTREQMLQIMSDANRGLSSTVPPRPDPAASMGPCSAQRVVLAGGAFTQFIQHPTFVPLEALFRKLPEEGMFTASPQRNFEFELGEINVPENFVLALTDFRFDVYRLNGAAAGDTVPIEERRLSTLLGYDVQTDVYRQANLDMTIDPTAIEASKDAFAPEISGGTIAAGTAPQAQIDESSFGIPQFLASSGPSQPTQNQFNAANQVNSTSPANAALSLLPQRTERLGPRDLPFTMLIRQNQRVSFRSIIFRPIPIPLAFFEVDVTGFLFPAKVMEDILACMAPSVGQGGGR